jgi:hypothetical protein
LLQTAFGKASAYSLGGGVACQPSALESQRAGLARFPVAWTHSTDRKSREIKIVARVLVGNVIRLFRSTL